MGHASARVLAPACFADQGPQRRGIEIGEIDEMPRSIDGFEGRVHAATSSPERLSPSSLMLRLARDFEVEQVSMTEAATPEQ